jgi:hypothetical protein
LPLTVLSCGRTGLDWESGPELSPAVIVKSDGAVSRQVDPTMPPPSSSMDAEPVPIDRAVLVEDAAVATLDASDARLADVATDAPPDPCAANRVVPTHGWVRTWGGAGYDRALAVGATPSGGVMVAGSFNGTANFSTNAAPSLLTSVNGRDMFSGAFDMAGNRFWTRTIPEGNELTGSASLADGSMVLAGFFNDSAVVIKRDPRGNNPAWIRSWPLHQFNASPSVAVDTDGSVLVAGRFSGVVDFDLGPNVDQRDGGSGANYLEKLDAPGNHQWVQTWTTDLCSAVLVVADGQGSFFTIAGCKDATVSKRTRDGSLVFAKRLEQGGEIYLRAATVDEQGSLYVAGAFHLATDFDPGPAMDLRTPIGFTDQFVSKFDSQGNYAWTRTWSTSGDTGLFALGDDLEAIAVDGCGDVLVGGFATGSIDIDPGPAVDTRSAGAFLLELDKGGSLLWAMDWASPQTGYDPTTIASIAAPPGGPIWVSGMFNGTVDFGLGGEKNLLTSVGQQDAVLMRLDP